MPKFKYALTNGKTLVLEGETPPLDADVEQAAKDAGVSLVPAITPATVPKPSMMLQLGQQLNNALPGVGAIAGAVLGGGPEDIPAVALGAGAGKGLRDIIAPYLHQVAPDTPLKKAASIAAETGGTALTAKVLPGAVEAVMSPRQTLRDGAHLLPAALRRFLPSSLADLAPSTEPILTRPAWQTWPAAEPPTPGPMSPRLAPRSLPASLEEAVQDVRHAQLPRGGELPEQAGDLPTPKTITPGGKPATSSARSEAISTTNTEARVNAAKIQDALLRSEVDRLSKATAAKEAAKMATLGQPAVPAGAGTRALSAGQEAGISSLDDLQRAMAGGEPATAGNGTFTPSDSPLGINRAIAPEHLSKNVPNISMKELEMLGLKDEPGVQLTEPQLTQLKIVRQLLRNYEANSAARRGK